MKINSKDKFIRLYIAVMAEMGYFVETFDFEKDMIKLMSNRKYEDLFYFFDDISDFDFSDILRNMHDSELIEVSESLRTTKITILDKMYNEEAERLLSKYDIGTINLVTEMIRELDLSKSINNEISSAIESCYRLANPNGVYFMGDTHSIVTDGIVIKIDEEKSGGYLVENATFVVIQNYFNNELKELQLYHKFEDKRRMLSIIKEIIDYQRKIRDAAKKSVLLIEEDTNYFEMLEGIKGYRYVR